MSTIPPSSPRSSIILAIETSHVPSSIAVRDAAGQIHDAVEIKDAGTRSQHLVVMIRDLLASRDLTTSDIEQIVVSQGPGSFTGLRIGIVTAKTLAYAINCQLVAVPTFELLAHQFTEAPFPKDLATPSKLRVIGDAFRGQLFVQSFQFSNGHFDPLEAVHMESPASFLSNLSPTDIVIGPGVAKVKANLSPAQMVDQTAVNIPKASALIGYSSKSPQSLKSTSPFELTPLYIRASAAEEKRQEAQFP
jgi:tRNA threonylcarbamoyladenosine biosynthesis protein TsaB